LVVAKALAIMAGDDDNTNPFTRLKRQVDTQVATTLQGLVGLPSSVSQNTNGFPGAEETPDPKAKSSSQTPPDYLTKHSHRMTTDMDKLLDLGQVLESLIFAAQSPYSPSNITNIKPPTPRELPGSEPGVLTFADAYEDLLLTSSGRQPLDVAARYDWRRSARFFQPDGESPFSWLGRLHEQGLLGAYFPRRDSFAAPQLGVWSQLFDEFYKLPVFDPSSQGRSSPPTTPESQRKGDRESADLLQELYDMVKNAFTPTPFSPQHEDDEAFSLEDFVTKGFFRGDQDMEKLLKSFRDSKHDSRDDQAFSTRSRRTVFTSGDQSGPFSKVNWTSRTAENGEIRNIRVQRVLDQDGKVVEETTQSWTGSSSEPPEADEKGVAATSSQSADKKHGRIEGSQQKGWFWK
jgi:hypothetical protein